MLTTDGKCKQYGYIFVEVRGHIMCNGRAITVVQARQ